jgi:DNA replication protein
VKWHLRLDNSGRIPRPRSLRLPLLRGGGTGKTHLALALGHAAIDQGKRVRLYNVVDLVNYLEQEKRTFLNAD